MFWTLQEKEFCSNVQQNHIEMVTHYIHYPDKSKF